MLLDFDALEREYHRYEKWSPLIRNLKDLTLENTDEYVNHMTEKLLTKTRQESAKYNFN